MIGKDLGWTNTDGSDRYLIVDSSVWSRPKAIESLPYSMPLAISAASLIEVMTPPGDAEFARRKSCAVLIAKKASILLPNVSFYRYFLVGQKTEQEIANHSRRFLMALEAFLECGDYADWRKSNSADFEWLRSERDSGYLRFGEALREATMKVYHVGIEIAAENGLTLDPDDRKDKTALLRALTRRLYEHDWQPELFLDLKPQYRNAVYHYLRLYTRLIATNLPKLAAASGLDSTGNDMGDMEDAYFSGRNPSVLGGRFGIALISEKKWGRLTRDLDYDGKVFPMGTPDWFLGLDGHTVLFDDPEVADNSMGRRLVGELAERILPPIPDEKP